jgi:hypothetical protein
MREPERIQGWRCIGCGKVDAPRPCVGICQDRKVELVDAADHDALQARVRELESALALIARVTPHEGAMAASWHALQARARVMLGLG